MSPTRLNPRPASPAELHSALAPRSGRLQSRVREIAENGESLSGPDVTRDLVLVTHHDGFVLPCLMAVKVGIGTTHVSVLSRSRADACS